MSSSVSDRLRRRWAGWRILSVHVTIGLTAAVALLSVVTGIANIGAQSVGGPLAEFIPREIQRTAGFTGALTGFLMIGSAIGMRRRFRVAWYSTVILLPVTALQGVLQSSPLSLPLVVLSVLTIPNVLVNRRFFDRALTLTSTQLAAASAIIGVQIYGTVGAYALRDEFTGINTLVDAFYYTLVTASTVGYGDAVPTTQVARVFGMSVVIVGTASFAIALGTLLGPVLEARVAKALGRMRPNELELLENHILVLGYSDLIEAVVEEIGQRQDFLLMTTDPAEVTELSDRGINAVSGDPNDETSLRTVGVDRARAVVVGTNDDGADALTILSVRQISPSVEILAVATNRENIKKLERAGANKVISPAVIAAEQLVDAALGRSLAGSVTSSENDG